MRYFGHTPSRIQPFNDTCAVSLERVKLETSNLVYMRLHLDPGKSHLTNDKVP